MSIDVLAFGPHPDDVEIFVGGTVAKLIDQGYKVGIIDLTAGEMGTRGSRKERAIEASNAAEILGVTLRENLGLPDGGLNSRDHDHRHALVESVRKHKPSLVIAPSAKDRHPDHAQGMQLVNEACFMANVGGYPSKLERHKPNAIIHYPMWWHPKPDFIIDVSDQWEVRMKAISAYRTQFYTEGLEGLETSLAKPIFADWIEGRGSQFGALIGVAKGEPFLLKSPVPVGDVMDLLVNGTGDSNL